MRRDEYVHGTEPSEQGRLALLNRLTNRSFVEFLRVPPGARVLEVGSGLGILATAVATRSAGGHVVGLERSSEQLGAAVAAPGVTFMQGDAHSLAFPDGTFDLVYCRYVLEHLRDPLRALKEMHRVLRPGGRAAVQENDISLFRVDPPCPRFAELWAKFADYQAGIGGDALIGRRLYRLFREAGFRDVELSMEPEVHWNGSPSFVPWMENVIGVLKSVQGGLVEASYCTSTEVEEALQELLALTGNPDGSAIFGWNRAMGSR